MQRIHTLEFEDLAWFPNGLRKRMTRLITVFHRAIGTETVFAALIAKALRASGTRKVVDMASGSGGIMPEVLQQLRTQHELPEATLTLTDLYPNLDRAAEINTLGDPGLRYETTPVDATQVGTSLEGMRTMLASFHHLRPAQAKQVLADAQASGQPFCLFEPGDNKMPLPVTMLGSLFGFPFVFLSTWIFTPLVRPLTWQQIVFTYLIPIIPLFYAWDGIMSGMRIYSQEDLQELIEALPEADYTWEKGTVKGRVTFSYLMGLPGKKPAA